MNTQENMIYIVGWLEFNEIVLENVLNYHYISTNFYQAMLNLPSESTLEAYVMDKQLTLEDSNKNCIHRYGDTLIGEGCFRYISGNYQKVLQSLEQDNF